MREATALRQLMSTMDPQVLGLIQSTVPAAKKRKTENNTACCNGWNLSVNLAYELR